MLYSKKCSVYSYFHGCFYKDSKVAIAICFSKQIVNLIFIAVSIRAASAI